MLSLEPLESYFKRLDLVERHRRTLLVEAARPPLEPEKRALSALEHRQLAYSSLVVHMYGCLEKFVEDLAEQSGEALSRSWTTYESLPQSVREGHRRVTLARLSAIAEKRHRGTGASTRDLLETWTLCEAGSDEWRLNAECYRAHTANIRQSTISGMFGELGVPEVAANLISDVTLRQYCEDHGFGSHAGFFLEDLAERRNGVAHGEVSDDLVSLDDLGYYVEALRMLGDALVDAVCLALLRLGPSSARLSSLGTPLGSFMSRRIVSLQALNSPVVRPGTRIGWFTAKGHCRVARIESIEVDHSSVQTSVDRPGEDFAVALNRPFARTLPVAWVLTV